MKYLYISLIMMSSIVNSQTYESTENESLGKYERININEQRVIEMQTKIMNLENEVKSLRQKISELEKKIKEKKDVHVENP